jgi:hypothetical protein
MGFRQLPFNVLIQRLAKVEEKLFLVKRPAKVEEKLFLSRLQVVGDARARNDEDARLFMEHYNLKRRVAEWCVRAPVLCVRGSEAVLCFRGSEAGRCLLGRTGVVLCLS